MHAIHAISMALNNGTKTKTVNNFANGWVPMEITVWNVPGDKTRKKIIKISTFSSNADT